MDKGLSFLMIMLHGPPFLLWLFDFFLSKVTFEKNFWVVAIFGSILYSSFLVIFTLSKDDEDHWIYPIFKMRDTKSWLALLFTNIFAIAIHFLLYGLQKLKTRFCCNKKRVNEETVHQDTEAPQNL